MLRSARIIPSSRPRGLLLGGLFALLLTPPAFAQQAADKPLRVVNEERILKTLHASTHMEFVETELEDALWFLNDAHEIPIRADFAAFKQKGLSPKMRISTHQPQIKLRKGLRGLLPDSLAYVIRDEVLLVTTRESAASHFSVRVYDVQDLITPKCTASTLGEFLREATGYAAWKDKNGGTVTPFRKVLVVSQTWPIHEQIEVILDELRAQAPAQAKKEAEARIAAPAREKANHPPEIARLLKQQKAEMKILETLEEPANFDRLDMPLVEIIKWVENQFEFRTAIDVAGLQKAGVSPDRKHWEYLKGLTLRASLRQILAQHQLEYVVRDDVLTVTSSDAARAGLQTRAYDVQDVLVTGEAIASHAELIRLIKTATHQAGWMESVPEAPKGERGEITGHSGVLVVSHHWPAHEQIVLLLAELRRSERK